MKQEMILAKYQEDDDPTLPSLPLYRECELETTEMTKVEALRRSGMATDAATEGYWLLVATSL